MELVNWREEDKLCFRANHFVQILHPSGEVGGIKVVNPLVQ